ncbi:MAG: alpha/beta hydrolase [Actinomycetota bacterium]
MNDPRPSATPATSTVETVRIDVAEGVTLAADVAGPADGRPILLFHGGGQTRHSWGTALRDLAGVGFRVASIDLRGHGDSDWSPGGDYTEGVFPGDVTAVARHFTRDDTRPILVGASLGGSSSMMAEALHPGPLAAALVLVDVAPNIEPAGVDRIRDFMHEHIETGFGSLDEVADAIAAYNPHRPRPTNLDGLTKNVRLREDGRWYWHWDPAFMWNKRPVDDGPDDYRRMDFEERTRRMEEAARSITVPTLLVRGRQSDLLSEAGAMRFLELVPHAEFVDVVGAGHMVAGDKNDVFNAAVVDFIERLGPA